MEKKYIVGIDEGTTGTRSVVFDLDGNILGTAYVEYPSLHPGPGYVEQEISLIQNAIYETCKAAIASSGIDSSLIAGVSMSTQGAACILVDKDGRPVRPYMIGWQDLRSTEVAADIAAAISDDEHYAIQGAALGATNAGVNLWIRKNEPEVWKNTARICTNQDYFLHSLGADDYYVDVASAHCINVLDVNAGVWSQRLVKAYGLEGKALPIVVNEPGKIVGEIDSRISELTGLPVGCKICLGAQDVNCSSFGAGAVDPSVCVMVCGTFGVSYIPVNEPIRDPAKTIIVKGSQGMKWHLEAFSHTSASAFRWFRDKLCSMEFSVAKLMNADPYSLMTEIARCSVPGANGVTALTCLLGSHGRKPNENTRGTFLGITLATEKADLAHAVLEGICYEMKDILLMQEEFIGEVRTVRLSGGVVKSEMWCQMFADILNKPIELTECTENGALGAMMYAGIGLGFYRDCADASAKVLRISKTYFPDPAAVPQYEAAFQRYLRAFNALSGTFY